MDVRRGLLFLLGIGAVVAPRRCLALHARLNTIGYDGTDALEPRGWLVTLTRIAGLAAIVIVVVGTDSTVNPASSDDGSDPAAYV